MASSVPVLCASFKLSSTFMQPCCKAKMRLCGRNACHRQIHLSKRGCAAAIISGTELAKQIHKEIQRDVSELLCQSNTRPHLSVILVGDDPASHSYVKNKTKTAAALGISSETLIKPTNVTQEELLELIDKMNRDWKVSGLLVQLPLPEHISERAVCNAVAPEKDVDGFHIVNVGKLCLDQKSMIPATPAAVWEIIKRTGIDTFGKNVVVAGRSKNVGLPISMLLHTDGRHERPGGVPRLITGDMVKEGATVIDVGINRIEDPKTGKTKLVGDVDFEEVRKKASFITPVPGGVGPMTVAMLMKNTVYAARNLLTH
ncbi:probable bifunctional methylenetetrahydrofolate dehydrogenase/cyclohydrolase 2 isoform X3 [Polypterus senegalus]|uniref:probable bifunctional methylenetetrahydrofolate dehydrogenase/cyclohydrolase 2 isoform X3 n=1 Tax=Polypterus senegalus TaxID=55291 RepID=UPI001963F80A|nr:probable bifunctional methylenetetrahydrofolate dehydrogenase/cyclohydrolase 2 isoform X3 [Polypterus senegalus]